MEKKKKTWTEPKLTALVRRKPEEGILTVCKGEWHQSSVMGLNVRCSLMEFCYSDCFAINQT